MWRLASLGSRILLGLAATALFLTLLLFLLGLRLALLAARVKPHAGLQLLVEIGARVAALTSLARQASSSPPEPEPAAGDVEESLGLDVDEQLAHTR